MLALTSRKPRLRELERKLELFWVTQDRCNSTLEVHCKCVCVCRPRKSSRVSKKFLRESGDERPCNRCVDGHYISAQSAGKEKEGDLKHHRKAFNDEVERPSLQPVEFTLTVSATLDHRPSCMSRVSIEPLLPQHRGERGQQ